MRKEEISLPTELELPEETYENDKDKIKEEKRDYPVKINDRIQLRFQVPKGKIANIMGVMNLLQSKFETLDIELIANEGSISEQDYCLSSSHIHYP